MDTWVLEWQSSPYERYETPMMQRALNALRPTTLVLVESFGGTDGTTADNGLRVTGPEAEARALRDMIAGFVGHDVSLRRVDRGPDE